MAKGLTKEKIEQHYNEVKGVISQALQESFAEEYNNEEENSFAQNLRKQLTEINETFMKEINELEQTSEWDKLCISFFGETNAGKSTLIESLRIIYNEESRLQKILANKQKTQEALDENNKAYSTLVEQTDNIKDFIKRKKKSVSVLALIISIVLTAIVASTLTFFVLLKI